MLIAQNYVLDQATITPLALIMVVLLAKSLLVCLPGIRPHYPLLWRIGRRIAFWLEKRLNRSHRSAPERRFRGVFSLIVVLILLPVPLCLMWLAFRNTSYGLWYELIVMAFSLGPGDGLRLLLQIRKPLIRHDIGNARKILHGISNLDTTGMDEHALIRKSIEISASKLNRQIISPLFWFVIAGLPGLIISTTIAAMDSAIGHKTTDYRDFGRAVARTDDLLNLIPARLTGLLIVLASVFTATAGITRSLTCVLTQPRKHHSLNGGWPLSAIAGALNLTLCGPYKTTAGTVRQPWIGPKNASAKALPSDLPRAALLYTLAYLIVLAGLGLALGIPDGFSIGI